MKYFRGMRGNILIFSTIYVLIGLILLVLSDAKMTAVTYVFSVLLMITGLIMIMYYIGREVREDQESYDLVIGVVAETAGIYLMLSARYVAPFLPTNFYRRKSWYDYDMKTFGPQAFLIYPNKAVTAAGVTPVILKASPMVFGRTRSKRCTISVDKPPILL